MHKWKQHSFPGEQDQYDRAIKRIQSGGDEADKKIHYLVKLSTEHAGALHNEASKILTTEIRAIKLSDNPAEMAQQMQQVFFLKGAKLILHGAKAHEVGVSPEGYAQIQVKINEVLAHAYQNIWPPQQQQPAHFAARLQAAGVTFVGDMDSIVAQQDAAAEVRARQAVIKAGVIGLRAGDDPAQKADVEPKVRP